MPAHTPVVLLVAPPGAAVPDVVGPLTEAGFAVHGMFAPGDFSAQAVIVLADAVDDPVAFTRQMRASFPTSIPILWLLSKDSAHLAAVGLDAGADACLLRPMNGQLLVAQFRALLRARTVNATADELRDLTLRLQKLYEQTEQDRTLIERLSELAPTALPDCSGWRFGVVGQSEVEVLPRGGVILLEIAGLGLVSGRVAALSVGRALHRELTLRRPGEALTATSRRLRAVGWSEAALASATVAEFQENRAWISTAGFPAPVLVKPDAQAEVWLGSGPFLGTTDTTYAESSAELKPGEKLILLGRGAADLRPDVRDIADRHLLLEAQPLADAIEAGLGVTGVTLVVAERKGS